MEKLNATEINDVLKDVRNAYRLLALYQKRLLDIVKYAANQYSFSSKGSWAKFGKVASQGSRIKIDHKSPWDWLAMYLYEFNLGTREFGTDKYHFKIVHQADTGFYDVEKQINEENIEEFADVNTTVTRLFFVISKNEDDGCPMLNILDGHLKATDHSRLDNGNWLAIPYHLQRFSNQSSTDAVLNEFTGICKEKFGIDLITPKS